MKVQFLLIAIAASVVAAEDYFKFSIPTQGTKFTTGKVAMVAYDLNSANADKINTISVDIVKGNETVASLGKDLKPKSAAINFIIDESIQPSNDYAVRIVGSTKNSNDKVEVLSAKFTIVQGSTKKNSTEISTPTNGTSAGALPPSDVNSSSADDVPNSSSATGMASLLVLGMTAGISTLLL